jgi:hypothetical protein
MPWLETHPVGQRERFLHDVGLHVYPVTELCARPVSMVEVCGRTARGPSTKPATVGRWRIYLLLGARLDAQCGLTGFLVVRTNFPCPAVGTSRRCMSARDFREKRHRPATCCSHRETTIRRPCFVHEYSRGRFSCGDTTSKISQGRPAVPASP